MLTGGMGFKKGGSAYVWTAGPTGSTGKVYVLTGSTPVRKPSFHRDNSGSWGAVNSYGGSNLGIDIRFTQFDGSSPVAKKLTAAATTYSSAIGSIDASDFYAFGVCSDCTVVAKFDHSANVTWQKKISVSAVNYCNDGFANKVGGNVKVVAVGYATTPFSYVVGMDGTPSYLFKKKLSAAGAASGVYLWSCAPIPDRTRDVFGVFGHEIVSSKQQSIAALLSYSGAATWTKRVVYSTDALVTRGAVNILGGVSVAYQYTLSTGRINVVGLNSAGALSWQRQITHASNLVLLDVCCDANKNTFVMYQVNTTPAYLGIMKLNENGAIVWTQKVSQASYNIGATGSMYYDIDYGNIMLGFVVGTPAEAVMYITMPSDNGLTAGNHTLNSVVYAFATSDAAINTTTNADASVTNADSVWSDLTFTDSDAGMTVASHTDYTTYATNM